MLTKIKADNMQSQIDQMTGMPVASPQLQSQPQAQPEQLPANMQGGRPQNFISQNQQKVGKDIFGGQSLPTPLYKMNPNYNGEPGVQQEDFEQF
jgi:hypothetical protein|tara:strand:- start:3725 stop:4006 length:282 start_codon:yes stop_codon:yes gene_type:complete